METIVGYQVAVELVLSVIAVLVAFVAVVAVVAVPAFPLIEPVIVFANVQTPAVLICADRVSGHCPALSGAFLNERTFIHSHN